jgi:hypothetical protein
MAQEYSSRNSFPFVPFVNSPLYISWDSDVYQKRNAAVHTGANTFIYHEAWKALGIAKECIVHLEARIPGLSNYVQMHPSMDDYRENAGEVMF